MRVESKKHISRAAELAAQASSKGVGVFIRPDNKERSCVVPKAVALAEFVVEPIVSLAVASTTNTFVGDTESYDVQCCLRKLR